MQDIIGGSKWCARCAISKRMQQIPEAERVARAKKASDAAVGRSRAAALRSERIDKYGAAWDNARHVMASAKSRCTNPRNKGWGNYGGRGIVFAFPSVASAAEWVLDNLGPPFFGGSIDRIDNSRGYEPGNLRWATRAEQARNKRAYRGAVYGARIQNLRQLRPDLTYETTRLWVNKGLTDEEITGRRKHLGCGVRHS